MGPEKLTYDQLAMIAIRRGIPNRRAYELCNYITGGRVQSLSNFLRNLLSNDLASTIVTAKSDDLMVMAEYVMFMTQYADPASWGSSQKVNDWILAQSANKHRAS